MASLERFYMCILIFIITLTAYVLILDIAKSAREKEAAAVEYLSAPAILSVLLSVVWAKIRPENIVLSGKRSVTR